MTRPASGQVVELQTVRVIAETAAPWSAPTIPRLWSAKALADRLDVFRALIFKLFNSGRLRGYRLLTGDDDRRCPLRFSEEDVLRLIREERR